MEVPIIKIGNSKGIRLSKEILQRYEISSTVELLQEKEYIILKPKKAPRSSWDEAFRQAKATEDNERLLNDVFEDESFEEWE